MEPIHGIEPGSKGYKSFVLTIILYRHMEASAGLEPTTSGLTDRRSTN